MRKIVSFLPLLFTLNGCFLGGFGVLAGHRAPADRICWDYVTFMDNECPDFTTTQCLEGDCNDEDLQAHRDFFACVKESGACDHGCDALLADNSEDCQILWTEPEPEAE